MASELRNSARRDRFRRIIRRGEPPCHVCGAPINYQAHHLDPLSFTIDHVIPLNYGGKEVDVIENILPAHRKCNRDKSDTLQLEDGVAYVTSRAWSVR